MGDRGIALDKKISTEILAEMREKFKSMPETMSHEARARAVSPEYPTFSVRTLEDYSRISIQATESVWAAFVAGKISYTLLAQFIGLEPGWQDALLAEFVGNKKLTPSALSKFKQYIREGQPFDTAVARLTGKLPEQDAPPAKHKSFDSLMDEIAKLSAKLRARISMATDAVAEMEREFGVCVPLFERAYDLRHYLGETYDYMNQRLNRYKNVVKKRQNGSAEAVPPVAEDAVEGDF